VQRSNTYVILFSLALTVILGGLLSLASEGLRPAQKKAEEFAKKRQILSAVQDIKILPDIVAEYNKRISSYIVNADGEPVEVNDNAGKPLKAEDIDIEKEFKKPAEERLYPVYKYHLEGNPDQIEAYILALYGKGLWNDIWGYIALETDMNTVAGIVFDHKGETAGLGSRITEQGVQERYKGKKIFDAGGEIASVNMLKSENNKQSVLDDHNINGLSGATITAKGINNMLIDYLNCYLPLIEKLKSGDKVAISMLNTK
jgi:Na+-transporting NADH:ubiquinone oxidoreductase subunit C